MPNLPLRAPCRAAVLIALSLASAAATAASASGQELSALSLEQLSDIVITSVSRQEERLSGAAASVFIITSNDILRSGARTLPEVLRLAPNLQVARADARNYAISARGFNSVFANKLLVLIDGRSVYSPLFSGVFWDAQDVLLADVERIEVISGPGATIYGSNAVNGVINIITKSAKDTQGAVLAGAGGRHEQVAGARYGASLGGGRGYYRLYAKELHQDDTLTEKGASTHTGFHRRQAGFRGDVDLEHAGLTLSGDAYEGYLGQAGTRDIRIAGANLGGTLNARLAGGSELRLQLIADHTERDQPNAFDDSLDTLDLELQHNLRLGERQRLSWGGGYRYSVDRAAANFKGFAFLPAELRMHWGNAFVQDEIDVGGGVKATVGLKTEHNNYTGAEFLPNLRLAWAPDAEQLLWASVARSVRAPSRIDRDFHAPASPVLVGGVPTFLIGGGPGFASEVARVVELGYRAQPTGAFSYAVTAFHSEYDKLRTLEPQASGPTVFRNLGQGRASGVEAWWRWQPVERWRLTGGVVAQHIATTLAPGSHDLSAANGLASSDPARRWTLRSSFDLSDRHQVDVTLRYNSSLPHPAVPGYYEMDAQWSWLATRDLDVSLVGVNLLHPSHAEFGAAASRSVFARALELKAVKRF